MQRLLSKSRGYRPQSLASHLRSIVRALVDSLIALYLPPGGAALLAQLAGALVHLPARGKALRRYAPGPCP